MAKVTIANADLNWTTEPRTFPHPIADQKHNRTCPQCKRGIAWTKQYMAKVNGR